MVLEQLRRQANRISRRNGAVGPHFECELVVVGNLSQTRRFYGVVAFAHRRVHGVDRNESDPEVLVEVLVGGNISAAALQPHFHVEFAALADRRNVNIFIQHFDIPIRFDHAARNNARLIRPQVDRFRSIAREFEWNLLQVENDVGRILHHAGDGLKFVQHAFHLHRGHGGAFDGAQ